MRSNSQPFANRILAPGPDGVTTNSNANSARPIANSGNRPASNRPPGGESFVDQIARASAGLAALPAGEAILVVHSGTIRAVLAIALDLAPEQRAALRDRSAVADADRSAGEWLARGCGQPALSGLPLSTSPRLRGESAHCATGEGVRASLASAPRRTPHAQPSPRKRGEAEDHPFRRSPRSVGRPMPAASKPPSTARICPVM